MDNLRVRWSSFGVFAPTRWRGWVYQQVMRTWIVLGGGVTHRISQKPTGDWLLGDLLLPDMPTLSTAVVYVGNPYSNQKIIVQLMDDRGDILGYAKYADKPYTRSLIRNEARMLEAIPENVGPRLIRFTPFHHGDLTVQTAVPGRIRVPRSEQLYTGQMRFLERLVKRGEVYPTSEHPFLKSLYARAGQRQSMVERIMVDLGDSEWPVAWMHGDLSAWNMRWWRGDYRAHDWEDGKRTGLAYLEAPHALIQFAGLIRGTKPQRAKRRISNLLRTHLLPDRYRRWAPEIAGLCALNILVSWYYPSRSETYGPDPYEGWLMAFVEAPGD